MAIINICPAKLPEYSLYRVTALNCMTTNAESTRRREIRYVEDGKRTNSWRPQMDIQ